MPEPDLAKNNKLRALVRAAVPHLVAQEARLHIDSIAARARQATDEADFLAIRAGQPARARALIESKRYLATHELIERLRAELAQAREVLRNVEWVPDHIPYATQPDYHRCPDCWSERREGHAPDCALSAALAAKGE